jgi:hypothetical protein
MIAAAVIPYVAEERDFTLRDLLEHLASGLGVDCTMTESEDLGEPVPEVRVATGSPLAIRIEANAELVYEDLGYLAEQAEGVLPDKWIDILLRCTARLEVLEADFTWAEPDEDGVIELDTVSNLDPRLPDVKAVILAAARFIDSFAYDNVNCEWLKPLA